MHVSSALLYNIPGELFFFKKAILSLVLKMLFALMSIVNDTDIELFWLVFAYSIFILLVSAFLCHYFMYAFYRQHITKIHDL